MTDVGAEPETGMGRFLHGMGMLSALAAVLALGIVVSGCSSLGQVTDAEQQQNVAAAQSPKLQAGEKIRVTVYNEPSLSGDFPIDPSGFVSLPLAGTLKAAGLTQDELEQALAKKYSSQYLKNPKVTVSVAEFKPFYIIGEVEHPGSFPYTSGLNVLSALAIAGGPTYRASKSTVLIQHPGEPALKEYSIDAAVPILPGDIIKVPQRYF